MDYPLSVAERCHAVASQRSHLLALENTLALESHHGPTRPSRSNHGSDSGGGEGRERNLRDALDTFSLFLFYIDRFSFSLSFSLSFFFPQIVISKRNVGWEKIHGN